MAVFARISFQGGALLMPAQNRYDREIVFEEAAFYARRYGQAKLELNRRELVISASGDAAGAPCASCAQPLGALMFADRDRRFCARCARKSAR
jgi:hypothetical protein